MIRLRSAKKLALASIVALAAATGASGIAASASAPPTSGEAQSQPCLYPPEISDPGALPVTQHFSLSTTRSEPRPSVLAFGTGGIVDTGRGLYPVCGASLQWDLSNNTIRPEISGELYMSGSLGKTARVLVEYFDVHDNPLPYRTSGGEHTADRDDLLSFPVTIDKHDDPLIYRVDVSIQQPSATTPGTWVYMATQKLYLGSSTKAPDPFTITSPHEGFGKGTTTVMPTKPALITWDLTADSIRVDVDGSLYFDGAYGVTAGLELKTFDVHGQLINDWPMPTRTSASDWGDRYPQNYESSGSPYIYRAELSLIVLAGHDSTGHEIWTQVGDTVIAYI